jgi:phycoerythrobilin:ferredoxin oxidoreductase
MIDIANNTQQAADFVAIERIKCDFSQLVESHLDIYLNLVSEFSGTPVENNSQREYIRYRHENDPARPMLKSLYGESWTERLLSQVMFPHPES